MSIQLGNWSITSFFIILDNQTIFVYLFVLEFSLNTV